MSEAKARELLPCPFCGGKAEMHQVPYEPESRNSGGYYIECAKCRASSRLQFALKDDCRQELAEHWNRRSHRSSA